MSDSEELVKLLLERNAEHLRQSTIDGTPFAAGPLSQLFGLYGTNGVADAVLNGTLDIDNLGLAGGTDVRQWRTDPNIHNNNTGSSGCPFSRMIGSFVCYCPARTLLNIIKQKGRVFKFKNGT